MRAKSILFMGLWMLHLCIVIQIRITPIPEGVRRGINKVYMADFLTAGDLALYEQRRNCYDGYGYHGRNKGWGGIITAVALGGAAFATAVAVGAGLNAVSKARAKGNSKAIEMMTQLALQERQSRETWQNLHAPSTVQYVDVQTGAGAFSNANAAAAALAYQNQNGLNSAIGGCNFLRVARYSAPQPCGCDTE